MQIPNRNPSRGAPTWGLGFARLGLPQDGSRSLPWWVRQSYLPFLRDDG